MSGTGSSEEEDAEKSERQVPRVICVGYCCECRGDLPRECQRVLGPGPDDQSYGRWDSDDGLHDGICRFSSSMGMFGEDLLRMRETRNGPSDAPEFALLPDFPIRKLPHGN